MEDDKKYIFTEEEKKKIKEDAEKYGRHMVSSGEGERKEEKE
ncbi:hypothetical protein [Butyrivibrio sp. AE2032]|nr:hypothetical protein [Butyrivibrio sp. AE2032]